MKKIVLFTIAALVCVSAFVMLNDSAEAETEVTDDSGYCGEGVTFYFEASTGTLWINGTEEMTHYSNPVISTPIDF